MQPVDPTGFMGSLDSFKGRKSNLLQAHAVGDRSLGLPCSISIWWGIHRSYWGSMLQALRVSFPIDPLKRCYVVLFLGYVRPFGFRRGMQWKYLTKGFAQLAYLKSERRWTEIRAEFHTFVIHWAAGGYEIRRKQRREINAKAGPFGCNNVAICPDLAGKISQISM